MTISSEEASQLQFSGSTHSYDLSEVEEFRRRVVEALLVHEAALADKPPVPHEELASAQRVRHQAVELAERMLRDVMGASGDDDNGLEAWQDAVMLQAAAQEEMAFAEEEAKRLTAVATAERDAIRAKYAQERRDLRAELQNELQASRDAAGAEAGDIVGSAKEEATSIVKKAIERADLAHRSSADETKRIERRLAVLHTALADAEGRFRRLASTAANEVGTLAAIIDQDVSQAPPTRPDLHLAAVDLTDTALEEIESHDEPTSTPGMVDKDPEVGFYQRRLAGLRDRLEKSGHPPE